MIYFRVQASTAGMQNGTSQRFTDWNDLVRQHEVDMWVDLPVVRSVLGDVELDKIMTFYSGSGV